MSKLRHLKRMGYQRFIEKLLLGLLGLYSSVAFAAGFTTNFKPDLTFWNTDVVGGCTYNNCTSQNIGNTDPTPFSETIVNIGGQNYFHVVVGDPATGFAMESYTRASGLSSGTIPTTGGAFSPDSGGMARSVIGTDSVAAGTSNYPDFFLSSTNAYNPLGQYDVSGTGSANPSQTVFRMVLTDPAGQMSLEVYKPFLSKKPRISQTVEDGAMSSVFVTDERALSYSDSSTPAPIVNNLVINDPLLPVVGAGDFEMALAQSTNITAGRFTYTPGTGWNTSAGWNTAGSTFGFGTYNYVGNVTFDPLNFDWSSVFDYSQNPGCSASHISTNNTREDHGIYNDPTQTIGGSCFPNINPYNQPPPPP